MPYAYGDSATKVSAGSAAGNQALAGVDTPAEMIAKYRLGGLILVGFSADDPTEGNQATTNVDNPKQVPSLTTGLRAAAGRLARRRRAAADRHRPGVRRGHPDHRRGHRAAQRARGRARPATRS